MVMSPTRDFDSRTTLEFTYVNDSLMCWTSFYSVHVFFAYCVVISGVLCMVTRLHPKLHPAHHWLGKLYIISMLWATAASILIHNAGLPTGVLYSFLWVLLGLTFGWIAIALHSKRVFKRKIYTGENKLHLVVSRMFSLKAFHGCVMFVSWINVAGRLFVTPVTNDFGCYSYPVFKQIQSKDFNYTAGGPITYLPAQNPNYAAVPWAYSEQKWAAELSLGPFALAFLFGSAYVAFQKPKPQTEPVNDTERRAEEN